jgi:predicted RNA-binding protein YlxR (DUF448 family)
MEDRHPKRSSSGGGEKGIAAALKPVLRTCIGCRRKESRGVFIRVGRAADGTLGLWSGQGRSAYIHATAQCAEAAMKKGCLERTLKSSVTTSEREVLKKVLVCQLR